MTRAGGVVPPDGVGGQPGARGADRVIGRSSLPRTLPVAQAVRSMHRKECAKAPLDPGSTTASASLVVAGQAAPSATSADECEVRDYPVPGTDGSTPHG